MTVSTTQVRVSYTGDASSVNFTIPFPFYLATDLLVILAGAAISSGFSVSGGGSGTPLIPNTGTLTMAVAPASGVNLQIVLNVPLTQLVNFVDGTAFPSATVNQVSDRSIQAAQRLNDIIARTIRAPDGDVSPVTTFPLAASRANTLSGFDASGNVTTYPTTGQVFLTTLADARSFNVKGDSSTDDTAALNTALASLTTGGTVYVANSLRVRVLGNLTVPANVCLKGPHSRVGTMTSNSMSAPYHTMGGAIHLASGATITLNAGACIDGLLIVQDGITFPQTGPSNYAGTAITYAGADCTVQNCMILGFNQGITSTNFDRPKCFDCLMDNQNGISFTGSEDITHIARVHMWNFGTFYTAVPAADLQRTGTGIAVIADGSGAKVIDCFTYGYNTGFATNGTGDVANTFLNCWADNTATGYGTGFAITGGATDTKLTACMASGCAQGYLFSMNSGLKATMTDCNAWGNGTHGILSGSGNAGDVIIRGGYLHNNPNGITYSNTGGNGILDVDEVSFDGTDTVPFAVTVSTTNVFIGQNNDFGNFTSGSGIIGTGTNVIVPTIASAASINLPYTGRTFNISGTTTMGTVNGGWAGREVTLVFAGVLSFGSSTGAYNAVRLASASTFTTAANSTLTIRHNGVQWYEIGRAA